jgi:hypothetical protein
MKKTIFILATMCAMQSQAQKLETPIGVGNDTGGANNTGNVPCLVIAPNADQSQALKICDKQNISVTAFGNAGLSGNEITVPQSNLKETHTTWLEFSIIQAGTMAFTIRPNNIYDDIDFVLYKRNTKNTLDLVRAATNGPMLGSGAPVFLHGNDTGLRIGDPDLEFTNDGAGKTDPNSNNDGYVSSINATIGETYILGVNNFSNCSGFTLAWSGSFQVKSCMQGSGAVGRADDTKDISISEAYPNPSDDHVKLDIYLPTDKTSTTLETTPIILMDVLGNTLMTQKMNLQKGDKQITFDTKLLSPGLYHLQVIIDDQHYIRKFVVQK